jgi:hypothetical protein
LLIDFERHDVVTSDDNVDFVLRQRELLQ